MNSPVSPMALDQAYFRYLFDGLGIALVTVDPDCRIAFWNSAALRMFGSNGRPVMDAPLDSIIPGEYSVAANEAVLEVVTTGSVQELEWRLRDSDGRQCELVVTIAPIISASGETIGASLCAQDITKRIALQQEHDHHHRMTSLGEMAGAVAHHLNNILGGVITSIDYAKSVRDAGVEPKLLAQISRALAKANVLVKGLLTFSEGDRLADDWSDLTEVVNGLADEVERMIVSKDIRFSLVLPRLPVWPVPLGPVFTILRNIAQNAVEAMPNGGVLTVEALLDGGDALVRVSDTGVGLTEEAKLRMFEPFWTTKGVLGAGTTQAVGLGLAIAHGLAQMIGATITATSEPQQGARFTVRLPAAEGV